MSEVELEQSGEKVEKQQNQENNTREIHPFDTLFFGNRSRSIRNERQNQTEPEQKEETVNDGWIDGILNNKHLSNINFDELMTHVDQLIVSLNELKPMFQKISPMIERFLQKDKD